MDLQFAVDLFQLGVHRVDAAVSRLGDDVEIGLAAGQPNEDFFFRRGQLALLEKLGGPDNWASHGRRVEVGSATGCLGEKFDQAFDCRKRASSNSAHTCELAVNIIRLTGKNVFHSPFVRGYGLTGILSCFWPRY